LRNIPVEIGSNANLMWAASNLGVFTGAREALHSLSCYTEGMKLQVGVKALIRNTQGKYLFIRRKEELPDGSGIRWDMPGGRINPEETLETALAREILEETGMVLEGEAHLLDAQDIIVPDVSLHVVRLTYSVRAGGDIRLSDEHQKHIWASLEEVEKLNVDDYLRRTLQALQAISNE
jgi:8-oxo-dGTP diphosphatase